MPIFRNVFFFGKEKIDRFKFLICYYSHLKDTENKIFEEISYFIIIVMVI